MQNLFIKSSKDNEYNDLAVDVDYDDVADDDDDDLFDTMILAIMKEYPELFFLCTLSHA